MKRRKLLEQVSDIARFRRLSLPTEQAYRNWITTMIYTHVLNKGGRGVRSPLDR